MCVYHYNNRGKGEVNNKEYELLKNIYACIDTNNMSQAKLFTSELMSMQSCEEKKSILNEAINQLQ